MQYGMRMPVSHQQVKAVLGNQGPQQDEFETDLRQLTAGHEVGTEITLGLSCDAQTPLVSVLHSDSEASFHFRGQIKVTN